MSTTGFRRIGNATSGSSFMIPRGSNASFSAGGGAEYGSSITDALRTYAITREPVAYRMVFKVAKDIFDNWFTIEGSNWRTPTPAGASEDSTKQDTALNRRVQKLLDKLKAKEELTRMAIYERGYGWAIIVLGFNDPAETLAEPVENFSGLEEIKAYGPPQISQVDEVTDNTDPRYGLPLYYYISRSGVAGTLKIHYTRVIHFATRLIEHDYKGQSVLDPVWDDLTVLRNIRWGMGQTMYRYGSGFPDITFTGAEKETIDDWIDNGSFSNLSARTYFAHNEDQTIDFKGLQGHALDPMNYYLPPMEHISCGSGIPMAILRGAQAGALTGSEVNQSEYYGGISSEQSAYEEGIRQLIQYAVGQDLDFEFNWKGGFELDEQKKQAIAYQRAQELDLLWNFYKRNEIRKMIDPNAKDLSPEEGGDDLKTKSNGPQPEPTFGVDPLTGQPKKPNPFTQQQDGSPEDKPQMQVQKEGASYLVTPVYPKRPIR